MAKNLAKKERLTDGYRMGKSAKALRVNRNVINTSSDSKNEGNSVFPKCYVLSLKTNYLSLGQS